MENGTMVEIRQTISPNEARQFSTGQLRQAFLIEKLLVPGEMRFVYSHYDRFIIGGAVPEEKALVLETFPALRAPHFLARRELGIVNIGGSGSIEVDGREIILHNKEALYLSKGCESVCFRSQKQQEPAKFYLVSAPAHQTFPVQRCTLDEANPTTLGTDAGCNKRTIYKMIHDNGIQSCQLVMGITVLDGGSIWNTMPCHTHDRRMEVYFYFDLPEEARIFHLMGEPQETRHLVVANEQAVISPPWSIHAGCGTASYAFVWAMAGENKDFTDMDAVPMAGLK